MEQHGAIRFEMNLAEKLANVRGGIPFSLALPTFKSPLKSQTAPPELW